MSRPFCPFFITNREKNQVNIKKEYLVGAGACLLCLLSAAINIHFIRSFAFAVGFIAGDISRLFIEIGDTTHDSYRAILLGSIVFLFFCGATTAGFAIHHPRFDIERPYGRSLMAIGLLFLIASFLEGHSPLLALPMAAFASGLQNALATRYRGVILRTTHITGIVTDFGQAAGMRLAGNQLEPWKIWLYFYLFVSFLAGMAIGLACDRITSDHAGYIIAPIYIVFGALFFFLKRKLLNFAEDDD